MKTLPSTLVARAALIRQVLLRDTNGEEDISLTTVAQKLKDAQVAIKTRETFSNTTAMQRPGFENTQAMQV